MLHQPLQFLKGWHGLLCFKADQSEDATKQKDRTLHLGNNVPNAAIHNTPCQSLTSSEFRKSL
eukprot:3261787-Amphidinium_carterae.2